jgi:TatD DNase family protein
MSWFDTHCHLQNFLQKQELEAVLQRADDAGVHKMVTVGTSPRDWADYCDLAKAHPERIYYSVGLHPGYVDADWSKEISGLRECWTNEVVPVALGEIGLDYFRLPKDQEKAEKIIFWQKEAFREQLTIAHELECPVIIHSRSAFDDCVSEIDRSGIRWEKVVFHCFTEGVREVRQLMERGGRASFTGIVTFPRNELLLEAVKHQGLDRLMIETDSPYLAPVPYRGKTNEPARVDLIGKFLNELFSQSVESKTWENSLHFYQI